MRWYRRKHVDNDWMYSKLYDGGGGFSFEPNGSARIVYIYGRRRIEILWFNAILLFRFIKRRLSRQKHSL